MTVRRRRVSPSPPPPPKLTKAEARRRAIAAWWARAPWPCVILAIDPGAAAGATILICGPGGIEVYLSEAIDLYDPHPVLESIVKRACDVARNRSLPLVGVLEDWGRGGPRGLAQWIGLGEARGPWRRALVMRTKEAIPVITRGRIVLASQNRWRSLVIPATGNVDDTGVWSSFGPEGWKRAAKEAASDLFLDAYIPPEDAAESACMGAFAARCDAVGKALGMRHLARHGMTFEPLEPLIFGERKRAKAAAG